MGSAALSRHERGDYGRCAFGPPVSSTHGADKRWRPPFSIGEHCWGGLQTSKKKLGDPRHNQPLSHPSRERWSGCRVERSV